MKRKAASKHAPAPKKKVKSDELPWKSIAMGPELDDAEFLMGLEEVEGVTVEYSQDGLKTAKFLVKDVPSPASALIDDEDEWVPIADLEDGEPGDSPAAPVASTSKLASVDTSPFQKALLPNFTHLQLCSTLRRALHKFAFKQPTPIQQAAWKLALPSEGSVSGRDIIGIAETGSGKTLAYGIPILQHLINMHALDSASLKDPSALILAPTRELALQVKEHLSKLVQNCLEPGHEKRPPPIRVVVLTGGMSIQKQRRQLHGGAHIIVATPGRLWDLVSELPDLGSKLSQLDFLVLDEADRMLEGGHFAELDSIFRLTNRTQVTFEDDFEANDPAVHKTPASPDMRTYVFSATMSRQLQCNLKKPRQKRRKLKEDEKGDLGALGSLLERIDFRDEDPAVVDLLPDGGVVSTVQECSIECLTSDKDVQLYHFLLSYPGKTLVFLSSIDGIRRLHPLFSQLRLGQICILHSSMQQRARLKAIERFQQAEKGVLLATDVAARGLDIPKVDHVVHFQLPRTSDTYIHRSGRTGRAGQAGLTLQMVAPEEKALQRELMQSLGKDVKSLATLPVEWSIIAQLKTRIDLARQIDQEAHKVTKASHNAKWLANAAEAMDIDLDNVSSDDELGGLKCKKTSARSDGLKAQLAHELDCPVVAHGVSARYITSGKGGQDRFVDSILSNTQHQHIVGRGAKTAFDDVRKAAPAHAAAKGGKR